MDDLTTVLTTMKRDAEQMYPTTERYWSSVNLNLDVAGEAIAKGDMVQACYRLQQAARYLYGILDERYNGVVAVTTQAWHASSSRRQKASAQDDGGVA
jgi:hypothetical protein